MATMYRARVTLTYGGVPCLHTTYWDFGATAPAAGATEALARVRAMFNSAAALVTAGVGITFDPNVAAIDSLTGDLISIAVGTTPAAVTFTAAGDGMPKQIQWLHRYSTSTFIGGRNVKGRSFIPGVNEAQNTAGGIPLAGAVTSWNTALGLLGTVVVSNIDQVVWHRPNPTTGAAGQSVPVTGRSCATTFATLRGRIS